MRLGAQQVRLGAGSVARELYGREEIMERHRHRYEFNNRYLEQFRARGPGVLGIFPGRPGRDHRAVRRIPGSSRPSSTRSSPRRRATVTRCSRGFVRAARACRAAQLPAVASA